jgi:hypothetical protein
VLGSVGDGGGAMSTGSGVVLRTSMLIGDETRELDASTSRGELGITHCKREVFLNM